MSIVQAYEHSSGLRATPMQELNGKLKLKKSNILTFLYLFFMLKGDS